MRSKLAIATLLTIVSCGDQPNSKLEYAHASPEKATISPLGGLQILKSNIDFAFESYDVCVRNGNGSIDNESLLKETKLAYAAWISRAGYGEEEWSLLNFSLKSECSDDQKHLATVILLDQDKDKGDSHYKLYNEFTVECSRESNSYRCGGSSQTLGLGRSGSIGYSYGSDGVWKKLYGFSQVRASFNQYVDWYSLKKDFENNPNLSNNAKSELISAYEGISSSSSFAELVNFTELLKKKKVRSAGNLKFSKIFKEFREGNSNKLRKSYRAEIGLYHVLLHEVGHNFGMLHSHREASDGAIYLETEGLKIIENGREKFVSTMAYSDDYLYLTKDDVLGIQSMLRYTTEYLQDRLP